MHKLFNLTLLLAICGLVSAQSNIVQFDFEPQWKEVLDSNIDPEGELHFENQLWKNHLPHVSIQQEVASRWKSMTFDVTNITTANVDESMLSHFQISKLPTEFDFQARLNTGGEDKMVTVEGCALRRNPETNSIEKVTALGVEAQLSVMRAADSRAYDWSDNSALSEGTWYKMAIAEDGVYRIDRAWLQSLGVDVNTVNPQSINIYGNGGELLPLQNDEFRYQDPEKNAIFISGEGDGSFDQNDYILFYGKGSDTWETDSSDPNFFVHQKHFYSDSAYYFIRIDDQDPKRILDSGWDAGDANVTVDTFTDHVFHETEATNFVKSGRNFFGDHFDIVLNIPFSFAMPNMVAEPLKIDVEVAARSLDVESTFDITSGGNTLQLEPNDTSEGAASNVANLDSGTLSYTPEPGNSVSVDVTFNKGVPNAEGWLDYIRISARRSLSMFGSQMHFRDPMTVGEGNVAMFSMSGAPQVSEVWDITDLTNVRRIQTEISTEDDDVLQFKLGTSELREFVSFANFNFLEPSPIGLVENQNLHALGNLDMIILSNPQYLAAAEELMAIHSEEGLDIAIVQPEHVYNEFSSGNRDVTAIKMLMKMLYDRADGNVDLAPKYLQILGDGSYQNRTTTASSPNIITFQSANSISPTYSYVSDDYFALLDDEDGEEVADMMDIGVGRIPCQSASEAFDYIAKVRNYIGPNTSSDGAVYCLGDDQDSPYGAWRNSICFVSDDLDGNDNPTEYSHMNNSEVHANNIRGNYNDYDLVKIYMDAYKQESTPGGERYPDAETAINQRVQNGALILNYIGHGGEKGWAHERVLDLNTIQNWKNFNRLPLFMTATCELSRYDDPEFKSAGELIMMNGEGGAIAMMTTTRVVYVLPNQQLNVAFFEVALDDQNITDLNLGDILKLTKNNPIISNSTPNKRNFSLLGDVALKLAYPEHQVYTTELNGMDVSLETDTIRSLQEVTFKGYVGDADGQKLNDFNGFVYPTVFDKESSVVTLNNDGGSLGGYEYDIFKNIIYKGKASVVNGDFEFTFVVPRDISYSFGSGRVSYYAVSGDEDAHGHSEEFVIGGALDGAVLNTEGPEVELFLNDSTFVFGGLTDESPYLYAVVKDENGINTVGNGIGHDLKAVLDNTTNDPIILNDFYESDLDTYTSGEIRYRLSDLSEGTHNLSLKVWDVHNNSSEAYTEFVVAESGFLALDHVLNYPNPFTTRTQFFFEHNQACDFLDVQISIFTVGGKMVKSINRVVQTEGFRVDSIEWDGKDDYGDNIGRGVYVYMVKVTTPEGQTAEQFEKLVLLR